MTTLIFEFLRPYVTPILIGVLILLFVVSGVEGVLLYVAKAEIKVQKAKVSETQAKLDNQIYVVKQLAEHGDEMAQRVQDVQKVAEANLQKKAKEYAALKSEIVPTNCSDAAKWAASKTNSIVAGW